MAVSIQVLGEITVERDGVPMTLPQSKKTRALLAYLAVSGRAHRREKLCEMLWDIPDDPRGALRWSLSKLRSVVDEPDVPRIIANREQVRFDTDSAEVDLIQVRDRIVQGIDSIPNDELVQLAQSFKGEFLEGISLTNYHEFHAWCVAEREETRLGEIAILREVLKRFESTPQRAVPFARRLAVIDPFSETSRARVVQTMLAAGHRDEAKQQYEDGCRQLADAGEILTGELNDAWQGGAGKSAVQPAVPSRDQAPQPAPAQILQPSGRAIDNVKVFGRDAEIADMTRLFTEAGTNGKCTVLVLKGEPGIGKSCLANELISAARERASLVFDAGFYEAENGRPFAAWIDAFQRIGAEAIPEDLRQTLSPLLPGAASAPRDENDRDRLFTAVAEMISRNADPSRPVLISFDDVHWCDDPSASLIHFVARVNRHRPVMFALTARGGELPDNSAVLTLLRALRHEHMLEEIEVEPLGESAIVEIVDDRFSDVRGQDVFDECGGNPLYAIEISRAIGGSIGLVPKSIREMLRDRISRLSPEIADALRWASAIGRSFDSEFLGPIVGQDNERITQTIEALQRHAFLREHEIGANGLTLYDFSHDLVRRTIYTDLSEPRRRLMHSRIAEVLRAGGKPDEKRAADIAHHAVLAGDARLAAKACRDAARQSVRLFANAEADALARRGMHYADGLDEPIRLRLMLQLWEVRFRSQAARTSQEGIKEIEELANAALDYDCVEEARLGFHLLSTIQWERGSWDAARKQMNRAEMASRSGDENARIIGTAEAARCLAMLEKEMGQAEAMLMEADALIRRTDLEIAAIPIAFGLLRSFQGQHDDALDYFDQANFVARKVGNRMDEFDALANLILTEYRRGKIEAGLDQADELVRLADRMRGGSEIPFAKCLRALGRVSLNRPGAEEELKEALEWLRLSDAKHRLVQILFRAARIDANAERGEAAFEKAKEAVEIAEYMGRPTETGLAKVALAWSASLVGDRETLGGVTSELAAGDWSEASAEARENIELTLQEFAVETETVG